MRRQVRTAIGAVCEELLMNALYDAPVDELGRPIFAEVDPHDRKETRSPRPVSIRYAATDQMFAVAVRDRFGRLAKNTILAYIDKCINSPNQIDRKTYGAGLGLYLVANAAASYVVNVAYGSRPRSCARSIAGRSRRCGSSACSFTQAARRC